MVVSQRDTFWRALQNPDAPSLFCSPIKIGREASDVESITYELPILQLLCLDILTKAGGVYGQKGRHFAPCEGAGTLCPPMPSPRRGYVPKKWARRLRRRHAPC